MTDEFRETTGFRAGREMLYVGDVVSVDGGNDGFMKVVKREDGYWLVDCSRQETGQAISDRDFKLECNLPYRYQIVDPKAPYTEPPMKVYCSQCDETVTGELDFETGECRWNENCAAYEIEDDEIESTCKLCAADPERVKEKQKQRTDLKAYIEEKRQELGMDQYRVMDLWPYFGNKAEVDIWFEVNAEQVRALAELVASSFTEYLAIRWSKDCLKWSTPFRCYPWIKPSRSVMSKVSLVNKLLWLC